MLSQKTSAITVVICALTLGACARSHGSVMAGSPSGSGASGGGSGSAAPKHDGVGTTAVAKLEPVADPASVALPADPSSTAARPVMGTATFAQRETSVNLTIAFQPCDEKKSYQVFIQQGTDCSEATLLGAHWDDARGTGISDPMCIGMGGTGHAYYKRANGDPKAWTIGGAQSSDVLGHAVVLYSSDMPLRPIACGTIALDALAPAIDAGTSDAHVPPVEVRAELGGYCLTQIIVRNNSQPCPDIEQYESCARANCDLTTCYSLCTEYSACLEATSMACDISCSQTINKPCSDCVGAVRTCVLGFCADQFACASPITPGGPCSKLEACCGMQGDFAASCLNRVHLIEQFSGDPSCFGVMMDWDTTAHLPVPCNFQ